MIGRNRRSMRQAVGLVAVVVGILAVTAVGCSDEPSTSSTGSEPRLGTQWAYGNEGYGEVAPTYVNNGGDPTGVFRDLVWTDWGEPVAVGRGVTKVPELGREGDGVAGAPLKPVVVYAYNLGDCDGTLAYRSVQFVVPSLGEEFDSEGPADRDICPDPPYVPYTGPGPEEAPTVSFYS